MKERPILFSGPMVKAILEGRKTQTRRVVKLPAGYTHQNVDLTRLQDGFPDGTRPVFGDCDCEPNAFSVRNPYGQTGDRLWVRETYRFDGLDPKIALRSQCLDEISYRADMDGDRSIDDCPWRPSIFMPRWASRITLEITGIRVERLNQISDDDCAAEGIKTSIGVGMIDGERCFNFPTGSGYSRIGWHAFRALWESINGPGSWEANPWVWCISFKRI